MKIVCDACQTKYSIADERVAGKVFKIRCKKCSQIIVVRGTAAAEPVEPPAEVPAGEWHVVIDGQQSGPFDRAELLSRHAAGEIDDETFVWRDGMDEWAAFASITELADGTDRAPVAASPSANAADAHEAMFSTRSAADAPSSGNEDKKLLAERNESSVLFTLGNLAKLASDSRPAKDAAPGKPGAAGGEGSGLIDIRALASTFAKPAAAKTSTAVGSMDDLPTFGPTTFGEPIVLMPSARPKTDRKMLYALFAALAMLAITAVVLLVVVFRGGNEAQASKDGADRRVATLGTGDPRSDGTATGASGSPAGSTATSSTASGSTSGSPASGSTGSTSGSTASGSSDSASASTASAAASGSTTGSSSSSTRPSTSSSSTRPSTSSSTRPNTSSTRPSTSSSTTTSTRPSTSSSTRPSTSSSTTTSTRPTTTSTTSSTAGKPDRIQCEFSGFTDKGCEIYKPATSTTANSNLPENLDRAAIAAGLGTIKAQGCGNKSSSRGDVSVQIKVNANGGVSGVTVKSSPDQALSTCVVAAAQKGTFAKTKRGASFGYVWRF